jgi:hypothetical protein
MTLFTLRETRSGSKFSPTEDAEGVKPNGHLYDSEVGVDEGVTRNSCCVLLLVVLFRGVFVLGFRAGGNRNLGRCKVPRGDTWALGGARSCRRIPLAGDEYLPGDAVFLPSGVVSLSELGVGAKDGSFCFLVVTADATAGVLSWESLGDAGGSPFRGDMV